tara:strand:- start:2341 stop:3366 length:1026 start_codon:yes stop_codon:yes gene_type:complete
MPKPLLSICIPSYNKAAWLEFTVRDLLRQIEPHGDEVELVVSDNASEDNTQEVLAAFADHSQLQTHRNAENLGPNGNFLKVTELAKGQYTWLLGNDDLVRDGAVSRILTELKQEPDIEYVYMNYTMYDPPQNPKELPEALPFHPAGSEDFAEYRVQQLSDLVALDHNCFTPIYCSIIRREHWLKAFQIGIRAPFFTDLETTVPEAVYIVEHLLDKPAYYIGYPYVLASHAMTWAEHAPYYVLSLLPELYERIEARGVSRKVLNEHRSKLFKLHERSLYYMMTYPDAPHRKDFSFKRYCLKNMHLFGFWKLLLKTTPKLLKYFASKHFWLPYLQRRAASKNA